jgi:diguanylate cyclase (GGDEF)-like protein
MNWSLLPDLTVILLLTFAFASVSRQSHAHASKIWLIGWIMIALHFAAAIFQPAPDMWGLFSSIITVASLTWAGVLFLWATSPFAQERSGRWMMITLLVVNTIYTGLLMGDAPNWTLTPAAALLGLLPLLSALLVPRQNRHTLRWFVSGFYILLSSFLLIYQHRPEAAGLPVNAVLCTIYACCCIGFWYTYRFSTIGGFITVFGFFTWAMVFPTGVFMWAYFPHISIQSEVWNLPKNVVAVGMILLVLESQIEHNKHLALHDALTGLPNRRLFQDRLSSAIERARRNRGQAALMVIDLDRFKQVNDTLGHHVGDLLLQQVGSLLTARVRRSDTVARTGGDEFSIILDEPTNHADAESLSHSLLQLFKEPMELDGRIVQIGASVGIAVYPDDANEMEALCIAADMRMYDVKYRTGRRPAQPNVMTSHARDESINDTEMRMTP